MPLPNPSFPSRPPTGPCPRAWWRTFVLILACGCAALSGHAQGLSSAWTYTTPPFGAGRQVFAVSTLNIGSDGSVALTLTVDDGSLTNFEYRLFWISATGDLLWASDYLAEDAQALAIRAGHLVFLEGGRKLQSVKRNPDGDFEATIVATLVSGDTAYTIEQGRSPGLLFLAETASDKASFQLHAYRLDSGATVDLAEMFAGVSGGAFTVFFPSAVGVLYQVERSSDLILWTPVGDPVPGTGSLQSHTDPGLDGSFYYRVRRL
jgi:hypothetical protein